MFRALAIILLLTLNLAFWGIPVLLGGIVKLVTFGETRRKVILALAGLAERFVAGNNRIFTSLLDTRWDVQGIDVLRRDGRYLILSNHVSWIDIFALFYAFHGKAPLIRFFLKRVLIWFPIAGQACWALEFPFMRRYTPEYLARHPEKRGRDLKTTRRACRRYRRIPVAILNFLEGTRFSGRKHEDQQSPYRHLLRPRVGGIGFVLASLGPHLDAVIDVTLVFPHQDVTMWELLTNRVPWIKVHGRRLDVPDEFHNAAITEPGPARERLKDWIEGVWQEKDELIASIVESPQ